jgi:hypothetical protein
VAYSDLDAIQVPADNADALATWGAQVGANSTALWDKLAGSWNAWLNATPAIITAVGDSLREGYYHHVGYTITGQWAIRLDGATVGAGNADITLPQPYHNSGTLKVVGSFVLRDTSTSKRYGGIVVTDNTGGASTTRLFYGGGTSLTGSAPFTWADGDVLSVHVFYETSVSSGF